MSKNSPYNERIKREYSLILSSPSAFAFWRILPLFSFGWQIKLLCAFLTDVNNRLFGMWSSLYRTCRSARFGFSSDSQEDSFAIKGEHGEPAERHACDGIY